MWYNTKYEDSIVYLIISNDAYRPLPALHIILLGKGIFQFVVFIGVYSSERSEFYCLHILFDPFENYFKALIYSMFLIQNIYIKIQGNFKRRHKKLSIFKGQEGINRVVRLLLAPAEVFNLRPRLFFFCCFCLFYAFLVFSSNLSNS